MTTQPPTRTRPSRGDELELTVDSLAFGGAGVARLDGYVVFVPGAIPGDRVRAVVGKSKRAYAEARTIEIVAAERRTGSRRWPTIRACRGRCCPTSASSRSSRRRSATRCGGSGSLEGFELEPIVPARRDLAIPQQARVLVRHRARAAGSFAASTPRVAGTRSSRSRTACWPRSAGNAAARRGSSQWCRRAGLTAYDRRAAARAFLRNLVVREGRRTGQLQARLVTAPGELDGDGAGGGRASRLAGLLWTRIDSVAETTAGRRDRAAGGRRPPRGGARRAGPARSRPRRSSRPTPRWPSGCTGWRSSTPALTRLRARLRPVLRDRDDRR